MRAYLRTLMLGTLSTVPLVLTAQPTSDRSRWSLEFAGDVAFPTDKLASADIRTGFGLGATVRMRLQPHLDAYAGWEWHRFASDQLIPDETSDAEDAGYTFGLRFAHSFGDEVPQGLGYWLRLGGLINSVEIRNAAGERVADTMHGLGWEVGVGLTVPLSDRLDVTPGLRYRSLARDLTLGTTTRYATLTYVSAGVGLALAF